MIVTGNMNLCKVFFEINKKKEINNDNSHFYFKNVTKVCEKLLS